MILETQRCSFWLVLTTSTGYSLSWVPVPVVVTVVVVPVPISVPVVVSVVVFVEVVLNVRRTVHIVIEDEKFSFDSCSFVYGDLGPQLWGLPMLLHIEPMQKRTLISILQPDFAHFFAFFHLVLSFIN